MHDRNTLQTQWERLSPQEQASECERFDDLYAQRDTSILSAADIRICWCQWVFVRTTCSCPIDALEEIRVINSNTRAI